MLGLKFFSLTLLFMQFLHMLDAADPPGLRVDLKKKVIVSGDVNVNKFWADSYSVGNECYCASTFDHQIGRVRFVTPDGVNRTVREICNLLGPGPGKKGRPLYNTIQCGRGPTNGLQDEKDCPGRVDHGIRGCKFIGPTWKFPMLK